ncbi:MICOS complex subunit MIC26 [Discoglossus pictus]
MFKVLKLGAVPASLSFVSLHVHASSDPSKIRQKELLKVDELSLYSSPAQEAQYVEDKQTQLEEGISWLRQSAAPYTGWCQDVYAKAKPKVETAVEHSKGTYEFLRDAPPGFYPRLGLIGFAGIVGLFLARGSRIKKVIYPLGFMGIGASLYYPQQAATIAKNSGEVLYDLGLQGFVSVESLWKDGGKKKKSSKKESEKAEVTLESLVNSSLTTEEASKQENASKDSQ